MTWLQDCWNRLSFNRLDFDRHYVVDQVLSQKPRSRVLLVRRKGGTRQTVIKLSDPAAASPLERQCLRSLNHPGIVPFFGDGFTRDRRIWMETKYIDGIAFPAWLADYSQVNRSEASYKLASQIFWQLLSTIQYMHGSGWLHGDLSPQNVLVSPSQQTPILIDFEHAHLINTPSRTMMPRRHSLGFASPHEMAGGMTTEACEQFALGKLGQMLFGQGKNDSNYSDWKLDPIAKSVAGLNTILNRATSERPEDRYPDLRSLELDLLATCDIPRSAPNPSVSP